MRSNKGSGEKREIWRGDKYGDVEVAEEEQEGKNKSHLFTT